MKPEELEVAVATLESQLVSQESIIREAFGFLKLELDAHEIDEPWLSKQFASYALTQDLLETLLQDDFYSPEDGSGKIVHLFDRCGQIQPAPNYLNGDPSSPVLGLALEAVVSYENRGVLLLPSVVGRSQSALEASARFRIFKAVVECDTRARHYARMLVSKGGQYILGWENFTGLSGIRGLRVLLGEMESRHPGVIALAESSCSPFRPALEEQEQYIREPMQRLLLQVWEQQLAIYQRQ